MGVPLNLEVREQRTKENVHAVYAECAPKPLSKELEDDDVHMFELPNLLSTGLFGVGTGTREKTVGSDGSFLATCAYSEK